MRVDGGRHDFIRRDHIACNDAGAIGDECLARRLIRKTRILRHDARGAA